MKRLVVCPSCQRRFDASSHRPGDRFRCPCGTAVRIPAAHAGEAEVVRCSACGGSRRQQEPACSFCGAAFTLHAQDLDTICPGCLHRASSRGRFCHHCGIPLIRDQAIAPTDFGCPACETDTKLHSRPLGGSGLAALECPACAGLWLEWEVFRLLEERTREGAPPAAPQSGSGKNPVTPGPSPGRFYRSCVHCKSLMHRTNYGQGSGIIIDTCKDHGAWFDRDELGGILSWLQKGGHQRMMQRRQEELREAERRQRFRPQLEESSPWEETPRTGGLLDLVGDLLG